MNFSYLLDHGDAVLSTTFLLLVGMSLASWYVIFWKTWHIIQERAHLTQYGEQGASTAKGAVSALLQAAQGRETKELMEMHLAQALDGIRNRLDKGLTILASVGSSAPFIGLFGTVWGIYGALTRIAAEGNASLNVVAGPMGEALIATAVGLFAAIPAVLAYNAFVRANRLLIQNFRHIAERLVVYAAQDGTAAGPVRLVAR